MDLKIEGLEQIEEYLGEKLSITEVKKAVNKATVFLEGEAKQRAPKGDTGALRNSISSKTDTVGANVVGEVFTPLEYAPYVEYGTGLFAEEGGRKDVPWFYKDEKGKWHATSGMPPHPYMRPALEENRDNIQDIIVRSLVND